MSHSQITVTGTEEEETYRFDAYIHPDTIRATGSSSNGIKIVVRAAQKKGNEAAAYIIFTNITPNIVESSKDNPHVIGGKNIRIFYDECLRQLIVKLVAGPHEVAAAQLDRMFSQKSEFMGLGQEIVETGRKRIKEFPHSKEPDRSWELRTLPPARSTLTKKLFAPYVLRQLLSLETNRMHSSQFDAHLVIEFEKLFLRPAIFPREHDITICQQELEFLATVTWEEAEIWWTCNSD